jgi:hypothetical protein
MSLLSPARFRPVTTPEAVTTDQVVTLKTLGTRALSSLSLLSSLGMCRYMENRRYRTLIEKPVTVVTPVTEGFEIHLVILADVFILATSAAGSAQVIQRVFPFARCLIDTGLSTKRFATNCLIEPHIPALSDRCARTQHAPGKHMGFVWTNEALAKRRSMAISGVWPAKDPAYGWVGAETKPPAVSRPHPRTERGLFPKFGFVFSEIR